MSDQKAIHERAALLAASVDSALVAPHGLGMTNTQKHLAEMAAMALHRLAQLAHDGG